MQGMQESAADPTAKLKQPETGISPSPSSDKENSVQPRQVSSSDSCDVKAAVAAPADVKAASAPTEKVVEEDPVEEDIPWQDSGHECRRVINKNANKHLAFANTCWPTPTEQTNKQT